MNTNKTFHYIHFPAIDSTNTWAKTNTHLWDPGTLTVVTADAQYAGKGRQDRDWISPPHQNVTASFCFFVDSKQPGMQHLAQIMAVSATKTLESRGFFPSLKWPNDLLLSKKKVGGILCEMVKVEKNIGVVAGIGINVNMPQDSLDTIDQPATSLLVEGGSVISVREFTDELAHQFSKDLKLFLERGFKPFFEEYSKRQSYKTGDTIRIRERESEWAGSFESLNEDGSLTLLLESGERKRFYTGDLLE